MEKKFNLNTLGIIFSILVQFGIGIWFAATMNSQIGQQAQTNDRQDATLTANQQAVQALAVVTASQSAQLSALNDKADQQRQDTRELTALVRQFGENKP